MEEKTSIGKIKKVPLREIWKKEDKDFTRWLEENIDYLNEILDFDITIENREERSGPFKVDLVGIDNYDKNVIIENQLEKTDHDHLGKLLTYLINLDANTAVWITSKPVDEHVKVIDWLNENTPQNFYLIQVEAIKIESQPLAAPLFTIISRPTEEAKALGEVKKEYAQRHILRKEFWTELLERAKEKTSLHSNVSPSIYSWIGAGAGKSGVGYNYVITNKYARSEIYLDRGKEFEEPNINKIRFDELYKFKDDIEKTFGGELNWEKLEDRRACRISASFEGVGLKDKDEWDGTQNKMIDSMIRLEKATRKYIEKLD